VNNNWHCNWIHKGAIVTILPGKAMHFDLNRGKEETKHINGSNLAMSIASPFTSKGKKAF
jgi:hypothetical protein